MKDPTKCPDCGGGLFAIQESGTWEGSRLCIDCGFVRTGSLHVPGLTITATARP